MFERERFIILSHHNNYSTISIITERTFGDAMRKNIIQLHEAIERRFTQNDLENIYSIVIQEEVRKMVYTYLIVGLLGPFIFEKNQLSKMKKYLNKREHSLVAYIGKIPSFIDGHLTLNFKMYSSIMKENNIPLAEAYSLFEKCYFLKIFRNISSDSTIYYES